MFSILNVCGDYILGNILDIIKRSIDLLGLIVPILLIIGGTINLIKGIFNPEDKKIVGRIVNCFASAVIVFLLPFIINTTMSIISIAGDKNNAIGVNGEIFSVSACWNNIKKTKTTTEIKKVTSTTVMPTVKDEAIFEPVFIDIFKQLVEDINISKSSGSNNSTGSANITSKQYNKVVLIGDSRFLGSDIWYKIGNDKTVYIAEGGTGLQYIKNQINIIKSHDSENTAFVINSGINDRALVNSYISYLNEQAKTFKGKLYYLSVNPVEESKEGKQYYTTNQEINQFNEKMKAGLDSNYITYLDSNSYLKANGYNTIDGVHYDKETSQKIYDYITKYVKS